VLPIKNWKVYGNNHFYLLRSLTVLYGTNSYNTNDIHTKTGIRWALHLLLAAVHFYGNKLPIADSAVVIHLFRWLLLEILPVPVKNFEIFFVYAFTWWVFCILVLYQPPKVLPYSIYLYNNPSLALVSYP
jgi:hypothetical protein